MKNSVKWLVITYLLVVLSKILIATLVLAPTVFADEYIYFKVAESFYESKEFIFNHLPTNTYPPIYTIFLSLAYSFGEDSTIIYLVMKILNAFISSAVIIPVFLLAKEILDQKNSIIAAMLVAIHPTNFNISNYLMAENIYYTLFLFSIYYLYKSFKDNTVKNNILLGIFTGLTILTKTIGFSLFAIIGLATLYRLYKKDYKQIKTKLISLVSILVLIVPWFLIRNKILFNTYNILGHYVRESNNLLDLNIFQSAAIFSNWFIMYVAYLILASGIILFIYSFTNLRERIADNLFMITLITSFVILFFASNHNVSTLIKAETLIPWFSGRPIGRYVDVLVPLIIINGVYGLTKLKLTFNPLTYLIPILAVGSQLTFFQLFPINNMPLSWIGGIKYAIERILFEKFTVDPIFNLTTYLIMLGIFILIPIIAYLIIINAKKQQLIKLSFIFFMITALIGSSAIILNSTTTYNNDMVQVGLWVNENLNGVDKITIAKNDCAKMEYTKALCSGDAESSLLGFFIKKEIYFSDEKTGYFITKQKLPYQIAYKKENEYSGENIYIYNVDGEKI